LALISFLHVLLMLMILLIENSCQKFSAFKRLFFGRLNATWWTVPWREIGSPIWARVNQWQTSKISVKCLIWVIELIDEAPDTGDDTDEDMITNYLGVNPGVSHPGHGDGLIPAIQVTPHSPNANRILGKRKRGVPLKSRGKRELFRPECWRWNVIFYQRHNHNVM